MKKAKILGIVFIAVIGALLIYKYCKPPATVKVNNNFNNEYNLIDENNVFVYKSIDDILITLDKGTGIIFLGFPECSWCQNYVKYLNDVAVSKNIDIIYYYNFKSIRESNTEKYKKLYKNRGIAMGISLVGTWKVILTDGTAAQMHLPGTLDESGIGHRDVGANQWHPDAALGNAEVLQNWCRSVPEDGSTSSWRVKQNWVRKAKYWNRSNTAALLLQEFPCRRSQNRHWG